MGQPKKQRRRYTTPKHMFKGREGERELIQAYGLRNARELWRAKSEVARIRALARGLLAREDPKLHADMMRRLERMGLTQKDSKLEDVLKLTVEDILNRRLQTQTYKSGLTLTIKQARQAIVHGHITVKGRRLTAPGHITTLEEAAEIAYYPSSKMADPEHPVRHVEKKASTDKPAEVKAEDVKPPSERPEKEAPKEEAKPEEKKEEKPLEVSKPEDIVEEKTEVKEVPKEEAKPEEKEEEKPSEEVADKS